ncbi:MAG: M15 family metallopeptidase [Clostridia bacterium]|nr:M15 family metallopeptidase [Clostridia bacterium]
MASKYKPSYRRQKTVLTASTKAVIVMLAVLVVTLAVFLIKSVMSQALKPDIVYPPESSDTDETPARTDTEASTDEAETAMPVRTVEDSRFDTKEGALVLVNRDNAYTLPSDAELLTLYDERHENFTLDNISVKLCAPAYDALCRMTDAYADRSGYCPLMLISGYRDGAEQTKYYEEYVINESDKAYVELPGFSDHHTGLAFDVRLYDKDGASYSYGRYATEKAKWLVENYKYYGFVIRYPANKESYTGISGESNHFRYVGLPHSVYMTDKGVCLEEYLQILRRHPYDDPLKIEVEHDEYLVWYCQGDVIVPRDGDYEVSGDNVGGFVVSVRK